MYTSFPAGGSSDLPIGRTFLAAALTRRGDRADNGGVKIGRGPSPELSASVALLAVAAAVCLSVPAGGVAVSLTGSGGERRATAEADDAVASLMACLNEAAKTLAGQTAAVVDRHAEPFTLPATARQLCLVLDDSPVVALQPHLSRLNLPPPIALS